MEEIKTVDEALSWAAHYIKTAKIKPGLLKSDNKTIRNGHLIYTITNTTERFVRFWGSISHRELALILEHWMTIRGGYDHE